jgi:hypothetical protein
MDIAARKRIDSAVRQRSEAGKYSSLGKYYVML